MPKALTTAEFVVKAKIVHGNLYDYSKAVYVISNKKVVITDPIYGEFYQTPSDHLQGKGNPKRGTVTRTKSQVKTTKKFIEQAKEIHGDLYDYSKVDYVNNKNKVVIIDPVYGEFAQIPSNHLKGRGNPIRGTQAVKNARKYTKQQWLQRIFAVHGDRYTYYPSTFSNSVDKILIECNKHGKFIQVMDSHVRGRGCPKCANAGPSVMEQAVYDYTVKTAPDAVQSDRKLLGDKKELDILIPSKNLAIEYGGLWCHTEEMGRDREYHYKKWKKCEESGIRLLTIFSDEDKDKVFNAIDAALGNKDRGPAARKLTLKTLKTKVATVFLNKHHLQGSSPKNVSFGLYDAEELVAVMAFGQPSRQSQYSWELRRFCTSGKSHAGAAGKLFKAFIREYNPTSVVSFSDRRWFTGGVYPLIGFEWDGEVGPDYAYVKGDKRYHKSGFRKSCIQKKLPEYYDEKLTEREMMANAKYARIWDCGKDRWVWNKTIYTHEGIEVISIHNKA